ncbi:MAG: helix-turn-helix domain-containing protein [Betaproteobacteria bacterium]|nr:helix-turn-helix domain-containing protein [Betaproteobacteria bacterium]MDE2056807.1 helix-turn-helix domain-containing protein [Betaproteobacteria bacterium]
MKEGFSCTQIARNLDRSKSTISREIKRNTVGCGYRLNQANRLAIERSLGSRNARRVDPEVLKSAFSYIEKQFSPEQVASQSPVSQECLCQHIYAQKASGGIL